MIVIMVGLPGTGKSTLARALAGVLDGVVVDKDVVRAAMFGTFVDYTREQDDLAMESVYAAAVYLARGRTVFIDGRAFARRYQLERALEVGGDRVIGAVCSDETARRRIETAAAEHLATNRTFELYLRLKAERETISAAHLRVNTEDSIEACVEKCVTYLADGVSSPTVPKI